MPTRQAVATCLAVARALGATADPTVFAAEARRGGQRPRTLDEFAEQVTVVGQRLELTLLRRDRASAAELVAAEALPLVLLADRTAERGPDAFEAFVLERREGSGVEGVRVDAAGDARPASAPVDDLLAALLGERAAEVPLRVLVPVNVTPTVGAAAGAAGAGTEGVGGLVGGEAAHGGDAHGPSPLARLWALLVREKRDVWLVFGYATLAGLFSLALPLSIQQLVQLVSGRMLLQPTYILVGFVLLGTVGVGALQVAQMSVVESVQQRVFARLALEFAFRVPRLRYDVALREDLPEVMNRFFETVTIQKSLSKLLLDLSAALLTILFGLILLTLYHPYFTFFSAALVLGLGLLLRVTGPRGLATSVSESRYKYKVVHWLEEMARANTAFKFAGRSALPVERMDALVSGYLGYRKAHFRVLVQQTVGVIGFKTLIVGTLLVLGIALVQGNQITLGQFVASEIVIVTVLAGIEKLISSLEVVYDVLTSVDKIGHVTDLPLEAAGGLAVPAAPLMSAKAGDDPAESGLALSARGLSYRYAPNAEPALHGVALDVRPGERVGVTGYEGSGQTTLLKLAGGLLDGYEGAVAVNGVPLRDLDRVAYRAAVGQLLSPTDLFDGTVEENVAVGRAHIAPTDVLRALERVGLGDWVRARPQGLRTPIANGGRGLPAHVVARLLLAQAVVGRPRLVVVDDYYQNVEPDCRAHLVETLTDRREPWTLLLVSHDPQFLAACDRVLVLDGGRVVRDGPWERVAADTPFLQRLLRRGAPNGVPTSASNGAPAAAPTSA